MIDSETCVDEKTSTGPSTFGRRWWRMIGHTREPTRAGGAPPTASVYNRSRACAPATHATAFTFTGAHSAKRTTRGTKTTHSQISALHSPGPSHPEMAM